MEEVKRIPPKKPRHHAGNEAIRTAARKLAVQMMYQSEMTGELPPQVVDNFLMIYESETEVEPEKDNVFRGGGTHSKAGFSYAKRLFLGAYAKKDASDEVVARLLKDDWSFDRLSCTVKNIFRLALYELTETNTPHYAVLTDYVNLACAFDDEKTAVFVNGLLEKVRLSVPNAEG
ncbi:MAG: transcription antitermination factor NusB [Deferribacteraceae bacterium]|jgi:N utilization substance protein B|nr:transcription antitermination factor NusB [Deferribacteraceae bacterium]